MEDLLRKRTRGHVRKNSAEEKAETSEECSNQYLTYDVLRIIFKYLNGMDLSSASMVCRSWLEAANNEKRTRGPTCSIENFEEFLADEKWSMESLKTRVVKGLPIKPALGLFFATSNVPFHDQDCHCKVLPANCNTVTLGTYGVVVGNREIEKNIGNMVYTFLPEIPGMSVGTFVFGKTSSAKSGVLNSLDKCTEQCKKILGLPASDSYKSRCLLLFSDLQGRSHAMIMINSLKQSYPKDVLSVWGGVAPYLSVCNSTKGKRDLCGEFAFCVGIALIGAVDTWSMIVDKSCKTKEQVELRLTSLRNRVRLKKHSMGFMFACCARGEHMFDECNVESSIFKKLFPEVPLVGCFGDGEFGENTVPNESSKEKRKWYNETSTVFMILTYG